MEKNTSKKKPKNSKSINNALHGNLTLQCARSTCTYNIYTFMSMHGYAFRA